MPNFYVQLWKKYWIKAKIDLIFNQMKTWSSSVQNVSPLSEVLRKHLAFEMRLAWYKCIHNACRCTLFTVLLTGGCDKHFIVEAWYSGINGKPVEMFQDGINAGMPSCFDDYPGSSVLHSLQHVLYYTTDSEMYITLFVSITQVTCINVVLRI